VPGRRATVARAYRHEVKDALERCQIPISSPSSMMIVQPDGQVVGLTPGTGNTAPGGQPELEDGPEGGSDNEPHFLSS
jgi:hypothetical protein